MGNTATRKKEEEGMVEDMSKVSLVNPIRLPADVLGEIARSCVADGAYKTASQLNQTSRAVHEETLPILYETMIIYDAEAFGKSLGETDSKGFKHVKYLIATRDTLGLIAAHINRNRPPVSCKCTQNGCSTGSTDRSGSEAAFCEAFRQLVFFSLLFSTPTEGAESSSTVLAGVCITVYRPVSLDVIFDRLSADRRTSSISLFGIQLFQEDVKHSGIIRAQNIHFIGFQEGAFLDGRKVDVEREAKSVVADVSRKCRSHVSGDPHPGIEDVLALMMDCAVYGRERGEGDGSENVCDITLRRATLDILTATIKARPSSTVPPMHLQILPCFSVSSADMQHHLEALANAFANEWTHYPARHGDAFFNVKIRIPVPADVANLPGSEGWMKGVFTYGSGDGTAEEEFAGFTCSLSLGHEYSAQGMTVGCHRTIGERHYPCEHVPFEMPPGIAVRQPAPVHTQVIHVTENIPFQMPEGFQLAPGFEMIGGFPEWVDGEDEVDDGVAVEQEEETGGLRMTSVRFLGFIPQ
ncbi:hypothetical protein QFC20_003068 [Naganishia adeliensis]|uniref:Uncharacterized protein n=1 Tax=Naganishia adeliensis TaxID=92952 RepID=A0ACC2WFN6_9TREE|nr:hypothetical protein QFC20_003068 [Naganishia adeliensis]